MTTSSPSSDQTLDPEQDKGRRGSLDLDALVVIEILFHPDLARVGDRAVLGPAFSAATAEPLAVGRDAPLFRTAGWRDARPLGDPCVSRRQLSVRWVPEKSGFAVSPAPEARRPLRLFAPDGTPLGDDAGCIAPGSLVGIGDRVLLLCACRPAEVAGPELGMVGESRAMVTLRSQIRALADTGDTVLISGETGVGKELVARALHEASRRRKGPFLVVNCAAVPEPLLESELFGHARGAFSGATSAREGLFRAASGGTVFLDEMGELPAAMQAKLLRVLQERAVRAVGESEERPIDVRIVAATNRDLAADVSAGRFRADLYSRLEGPSVHVPPLRDRREDIPRLFTHFLRIRIEEDERVSAQQGQAPTLRRLCCDPGSQPPPIPMEFMLSLLGRDWARNVRELEKLVAALAAANKHHGPFTPPPMDAPSSRPRTERPSAPPPSGPSSGGPRALDEGTLMKHLEAHDHIQHRVARALGISRTTLDKWLRELGIRRPKDLTREAIDLALAEFDGDLERAARALRVSLRGLKLRLTELGVGPSRKP